MRLEGLGTPGGTPSAQAAPGAVRMQGPMVMMQASPAKMPFLQAPQLIAPVEVQERLAAKERQLEELSRYAASLQHELAAERARAPRTLSGAQEVVATDPVAELQRLREIAAATAAEGAAVNADFARAAEIAQQLNAWFVANAAKMRTQDDRASPSAHLEAVTAALTQQMQGVANRWAQMQAVLAAELPDAPSAPAQAPVALPVQQVVAAQAAPQSAPHAPAVAAAQAVHYGSSATVQAAPSAQPGVLRSASSSHYGASATVQAASAVQGSSVSVQAAVYAAPPGSEQLSASMGHGAALARPTAPALAVARVSQSVAVAVPVAAPAQPSAAVGQAGQVAYTGVSDASWAPASPRNCSSGDAGVADASWAPASPHSAAAAKGQSIPWSSGDPFASAYDNMDDDLTPMESLDQSPTSPEQYMSMRVGER